MTDPTAKHRPDSRSNNARTSGEAARKDVDDRLENALEGSFPASDAPGLTPGPDREEEQRRQRRRRELDEKLDQALENTFPASDPFDVTPHSGDSD